MKRKQSPFAAFPGKMREYHLLFADGRRTTYKPVWATDAGHATELYTAILGDIEPVAYGLHVSSVRPIVAESNGTLRDIPATAEHYTDIQPIYHPDTGAVIGEVGTAGYWSFFGKAGESERFLHGPYRTQQEAANALIGVSH